MSIYNTAVTYEPEWEPPTVGVLDAVAVDDTFRAAIEEFHTGLGSITIQAVRRDRSGSQLTSSVRKIKITGGGMNKVPPISSDELARLCTYLGQQHCDASQAGPIVYRCYFRGNSEALGRSFQKNKSFNLKPGAQLDDEDEDDGDDDARPSQMLGSRGGPFQMRGSVESELVQIVRLQAAQSQQLMLEARLMLQQSREDQSANAQSINAAWSGLVTSANTMLEKFGEEAEHARLEVSKVNDRLLRLSEDQVKSQNGEKDVLRYAMDTFKHAMETQWSALGRDMSWERQIMYQQFEALAQDNKKDNRRGWIKDFAPIMLAVAGQIIAKTGNKAQGDLLQQLAEDQLKQEPEDETENEEDSEEDDQKETAKPAAPQRPRAPQRPVVDVKVKAPDAAGSPRTPAVMGVPVGTDAGAFFDANPIASGFQLFGNMLKAKDGQLKGLRPILGAKNYRTLRQAMLVNDDVAARTLGTKLFGGLMLDADKLDQLKDKLDSEQLELLTDLSKMLFGATAGFPANKEAG